MIINLTSEKLEELIERMKDGDREEFINAAEELREILKSETKEKVTILIQEYETADTSDDRFAALIALGNLGDNGAVETLISALSEDSIVASYLGEIGDERAVEPLIKFLKTAQNPFNKSDFARALGKLGDKRAVEPLIELLHENSIGSSGAAEALGELCDVRAVEPLIECLKHIGFSDEIAKALGKIGDRRAVSPLITFWEKNYNIKKGSFYKVYEFIFLGIHKLWMGSGIYKIWDLIDAAAEARERGAYSAAGALYMIGDEYVQSIFDILLENLKNPDLISKASNVLGKIGDIRAVEPLIATLTSLDETDEFETMAIAEALGKLGDIRAVEPLISTLISLDEYDDFGTMAIAEALGKLGDIRAVEPLTTKLWNEHDEGRVCLAIAEALEKLGDKRAVEPLIEVLKKEYSEYGDSPIPAIAKALGELGDEKAIEPLLEAIRGYHEDKQTMNNIIDAVLKLKSGQ